MINSLKLHPKIEYDQWTGLVNTLIALSRFFSEGGEMLAETLPQMANSCQQLGHHDSDWLSLAADLEKYAGAEEKELREMCFEFNRLFVGPASPPAPPYESVYLSADHLVMQEQTVEVRRLYQSENLKAVSQGTVPDDYLATELEFAAYLLNRSREECTMDNNVRAENYMSFCEGFLQEHPGRWLKPFTAAVRRNARHPVFSTVIEVLIKAIELPLPSNT